MKIRFTKMHGLGNDFVVIDAVRQDIALTSAQARWLADRHFGVGCDQVLLVERATQADCDFRYRIFNASGGEVEQCGNGARCFVRFVHDQGLSDKRTLRVETRAGIIVPKLEADGNITVDMGRPRFGAHEIPYAGASLELIQPLEIETATGKRTVEITALSMGNPHAVQLVSDVDTARVAEDGPLIESHRLFTQGANAGFMQIVSRHEVKLRVFERGAGETLACGSGACAATVAGIRRGLLDTPVRVTMRGGNLSVAWAGGNAGVMMTGPAETVFTGEIELPQ